MTTENPPRLRLEQYLGMQIRRERQAQELKLADVARIAGISPVSYTHLTLPTILLV